MLLKKKNLQYLLYCLMVVAAFVQNIDVSPYLLKFAFNKIFYLCSVVFLTISIKSEKIEISKNMRWATGFLLVYAVFYVVANFYHKEKGWVGLSLGNGIFYFISFLIFHVASREFSFRKLIAPFYISIAGLLLLSLAMFAGLPLQYFNPDEDLVESYIITRSTLSLFGFSGVYLNQNGFVVLAFLGAATYLMSYQYQRKYHQGRGNYLNLLLIFVSLGFVVMTMSRAGLLAGFILLFFYFLKILKNKNSLYFIFGLLFFALFAMHGLGDYVDNIMLRIENDGTSNRWDIWMDALAVFKENVLLGSGEYKYYTPFGHLTSHNIYIQLLASQGLLVFMAWFGFIWIFFFCALKNMVEIKMVQQPIAVIASICLVAILVHQAFETMLIGAGVPLVLFMFLMMNAIKGIVAPVEGSHEFGRGAKNSMSALISRG